MLRPCLVIGVLKGKSTGNVAVKLTYGTKHLKFAQRRHLDLIIQNNADINAMGLAIATRFDLDSKNIITLPWTEQFFGCWSGHKHPRLCTLPEEYAKAYFYLMALRQANEER